MRVLIWIASTSQCNSNEYPHIYKEVDKKYTGCNLKTTELLDCTLIGVCAVIRSNTVYTYVKYHCLPATFQHKNTTSCIMASSIFWFCITVLAYAGSVVL